MFSTQIQDADKERLERWGYKVKMVIEEGLNSSVYLMEYRKVHHTAPDEIKRVDLAGQSELPSKVLACKVVDSTKMPKALGAKFFMRELDILMKISHPHIIHVHSILQCTKKFFVFMRYAESGNVCDYIMANGPLNEKQTRSWIRQVTVALNYLHTLDIAHRDIKAENLLITNNLNVKLTDFGFSRFVVNKKGKEVSSTTFCGSLAYAAPELLRGMRYQPKLADVWALGIVMYVMLNASLPFDTSNIVQLYTDEINKNFRFRTSVQPKVSGAAMKTVEKLLEPVPNSRLSLSSLLSSKWMIAVNKYGQLTDSEHRALEDAKRANKAFKELAQKKVDGSFTMIRGAREVSIPSVLNQPPSGEKLEPRTDANERYEDFD